MVALTSATSLKIELRTYPVTRRLELTSLRQCSNLDSIILNTFDDLEPGQTMVVTDIYNPGWIQELLDDRRPGQCDEAFFHADKQGRQYELFVIRPGEPNRDKPGRNVPEKFQG